MPTPTKKTALPKDSPIRETLAPLIRAAGVRAVANEIGVSDAAVHRWMSGRGSIGRDKIEAIAGRFGYRIGFEWIEKR